MHTGTRSSRPEPCVFGSRTGLAGANRQGVADTGPVSATGLRAADKQLPLAGARASCGPGAPAGRPADHLPEPWP